MGDSDDEYERRRGRDKFRRERNDYQDRNPRRDDWQDRYEYNFCRNSLTNELFSRDGNNSWGGQNRDRQQQRRDYRDYGGQRRDTRYGSPADRSDMSPPMKRMRRDWEDRGYPNYDMGFAMGVHNNNWAPIDNSQIGPHGNTGNYGNQHR